MAQEKVLLTPELFENILLKLPIRDLLVNAQRANKFWNNTIASSSILQRALFFQSEPKSARPTAYFNPLLQSAFPAWSLKLHDEGSPRTQDEAAFQTMDWNKNQRKRDAYVREKASWRKMLPVQPGINKLEVNRRVSARGGGSALKGGLDSEDGIRMGTIYDITHNAISRRISSFCVIFRAAESLQEKEWANLTINISHTVQCTGGSSKLAPYFLSEGKKEVDLQMEVVESRQRGPRAGNRVEIPGLP